MTKQRSVFRIMVVPTAIKTLDGLSERLGITQIAMTSKLIEWFDQQPDGIRAGIMGLNLEGLTLDDPAVAFLKGMAKSDKKGSDHV